MDYADQRYHSPGTGRFLTPDPFNGSFRPRSPLSWNRYSYVRGDPINRTDPTGLWDPLSALSDMVGDCESGSSEDPNCSVSIAGVDLDDLSGVDLSDIDLSEVENLEDQNNNNGPTGAGGPKGACGSTPECSNPQGNSGSGTTASNGQGTSSSTTQASTGGTTTPTTGQGSGGPTIGPVIYPKPLVLSCYLNPWWFVGNPLYGPVTPSDPLLGNGTGPVATTNTGNGNPVGSAAGNNAVTGLAAIGDYFANLGTCLAMAYRNQP